MKSFGRNGRKKPKVLQYTRVRKSLVPSRPFRPEPIAPDDPLGLGADDLPPDCPEQEAVRASKGEGNGRKTETGTTSQGSERRWR